METNKTQPILAQKSESPYLKNFHKEIHYNIEYYNVERERRLGYERNKLFHKAKATSNLTLLKKYYPQYPF